MMITVILGPWKLEIDRQGTRELYEKTGMGAASLCGCAGCANYVASRGENLPVQFLRLLMELGIDPQKETSVRRVAPLDAGHSLYAGSFAAVGRILEGPEDDNAGGWRLDVFEEAGETAHVAARSWREPPLPWPRGGTIRIRYLVVLPWIGDDPEAPIDLAGCNGPADKPGKT